MNTLDANEPRLLRSFVAVAEELHFGRAAARLHISQPPLSVQIRTLEDRLGARLFDRDRRSVKLTEAGAFFLDRARFLLAEGERTGLEVARIARGESGALAIGYTSTATYQVLPPLLRRFRAQRPTIRLELVELRSALQLDALRAGRIEVGFACGPLAPDDLVERVLSRERFVAAVPRSHPLAKQKHLRLSDLAKCPIVAVRPDVEPAWANACADALRRARTNLEIVQETDGKIALLGLVASGLGLAIVSESMRALGREGVVYRPIVDLRITVPLVALHPAKPSPRVGALLGTFAR